MSVFSQYKNDMHISINKFNLFFSKPTLIYLQLYSKYVLFLKAFSLQINHFHEKIGRVILKAAGGNEVTVTVLVCWDYKDAKNLKRTQATVDHKTAGELKAICSSNRFIIETRITQFN